MKLHKIQSVKNGKVYRLSATDVLGFFNDHISGGLRSLRSHLRVRGAVLLQLFDSDGELKIARTGTNLIVTTGLNAAIDRLQAAAVAVHDYQAVGTGTTAADAGDTALETETGTRVQGTLSQPAATTDRLVSTFAAGNGTGALTETGRLNASSSGNLFARQVFSVINKAAGDSLQVTHDITVS